MYDNLLVLDYEKKSRINIVSPNYTLISYITVRRNMVVVQTTRLNLDAI